MGYTGAVVNDSAFPRARLLQYAWVGGTFDLYAGMAYSQVTGGLASGYFHNNSVSPTVGLRYVF